MTVNLAWRDAIAEIDWAFNRAERSAGWVETFTPWQIAALQRPCKSTDTSGKRSCRALEGDLLAACKSNVLPNKTWTETVWQDVSRPNPFAQAFGQGASWETHTGHRNETEGQRRERLWRAANPTVKQSKEITHANHITAEAFAAWLAANKIEPSRHVAAWFKAQAVNTDSRPIAPPADWKALSPHGLQRLDTTDAGRLVRLADLVHWLMDTRELPCKTAVEQVCSTLEQRPSAAAGWLYLLRKNDYAVPVTPEHSFYWLPVNAPADDNPGEPNDNGLAGAINNMRSHWTDSATIAEIHSFGARGLEPLAIRIDAAHLLWGYGRRVEAIEQPLAAAPAASVVAGATVKETTAQRNDRWLRVVDEEEGMGPKVGAQARAIQRIVTDEAESQHKVKKGIQSANAARAERYREGKVSPIKRKGSKPAGPFDGLRKKT